MYSEITKINMALEVLIALGVPVLNCCYTIPHKGDTATL